MRVHRWPALAIALSLLTAANNHGATAPTITKIYDAPGQIWGGLAGDGSNLYFATLAKSSGWTYSKVVSITATGTERWQWDNGCPLAGGNMRLVPTISPDGTRLFVGADHGKVFCLNTTMSGINSYPQGVVWEYPASGQPALSQPVRSEIAYDPVAPAPGGGTVAAVYFHANDGYTYSINATTGAFRWSYNTGNLSGPPTSTDHPIPWSSAPVLGLAGTVYVGSANGYLYCLNPADGTRNWRVKLNASGLTVGGEPIEATPAIGENGWIYVATRTVPGLPGGDAVSHLYAIDPTVSAANPDDAAEKLVWPSADIPVGTQPGTIGGLVVEWCGVVYVTDFYGDVVFGFDGTTGERKISHYLGGKPCQAPGLNRNGMLYLGTSKDAGGVGTRAIHGRKVSPAGDVNLDWSTDVWTAGPGAPGVFGDFFGGVLVRADGSGTTYLADANPDTDTGAVYKFTSGGPSMAGDWPTLGCGNRRQHKARTYPYTMVELGVFPQGVPESLAVFSVDALGRAVGWAHGKPGYPYYSFPLDWYGAYWIGTPPSIVGNYSTLTPRQWPRAANLAGRVVGYTSYTYTGPIIWPSGFSGGDPQTLPLPSGLSDGEARDINADSSIIGFSNSGSNPQVVRWDFDGSTWIDSKIGAPDGGKAYGYALSNTKRICGKALFTAGGQWQGYTTPQGAEDFSGTVPLGAFGGAQSEAWEVHDVGGTAGWAHKRIGSTDYQRAFRVPPDFFTLDPADELPGFAGQLPNGAWRSYGYGLNGYGQVVGSAHNTSGDYRAFLYQPGATALTDLTALAPSGWVLTSAVGISDCGHIVGSGYKNGASRQWLIYPQPQE
ncbi:MAG: PQQ-binding-like beta-propeller repeat protein [Verrucomicrobia bacterium]|nr:PQQ-binding-like beta-propeller repeat protein [Verrucomicrobiota bacterium]